jgi:hypothetical protein
MQDKFLKTIWSEKAHVRDHAGVRTYVLAQVHRYIDTYVSNSYF